MTNSPQPTDPKATSQGQLQPSRWYSHYVLFVLVIVYIFNFIDRNILSILAEDIKADLGITDAQMGFLYGTVFAVFYAVFGIPLARFADVWTRRSLISVGLGFWSLMTAASGLARSFPQLALYRIGVGIGEASASPAAYSMLADYYPPHLRATVIAIYAAGVYIGAGIGIFLGGYILESWAAAYPDGNAPFGLKGWQAAFMAVGLPGIAMAIWVRTLREPVRGISEGLVAEKHPAPFKVLGKELTAVIPPLNVIGLLGHPQVLKKNMIAAGVFAVCALGLIWLTGSIAQWVTSAFGVYVTFSWAQSLKIRDPATYHMMFGSKAYVYTMLAFPMTAFVGYGAGFWIPPLLLRVHEVGAAEVGLYLGIGSATGGFVGITLGGILADYLKRLFPSGRIVLGYFVIAGSIPLLVWMLMADDLLTAFWINFFLTAFSACAGGVPPSTAADLVMPRMRATAGAYFILMNTFLGLALGPYFMGQFSDLFFASGMNDADSLAWAIGVSMLTFVPALIFMVLAQKHLPREEASRVERARALGEDVSQV
ncbi:MAG: MFS transporter [Pseudomonadota bacterium]